MRKVPCGLADLARAFAILRPSSGDCAAVARLLGLKGNIVFESTARAQYASRVPRETLEISPKVLIQDAQEDRSPDSSRPPRPRRWEHERWVEPPSFDEIGRSVQLTMQRPPPMGEMPPYVAEAEELDFHRGMHRNLFSPEPLVPRGQLRSLVSDLITTSVPGDPDIPKLVTALAQGRLPRKLPHRRRRGFARRVYVIWDTAEPMWLFRRDAVAIIDALHALSSNAVQSENISRGPPPRRPLPGAAAGDTILVLSGLGIGGKSRVATDAQAGWHKFGAFHHRLGLRLVALVPFHHRRWPALFKQNYRMLHWHRPGIVAALTQRSDLEYLACILSLAAVVDPALLRYARIRMLPSSDAGVEADFVNAHWVASHNPRVIVFHPRWTVFLRGELAQNESAMEAARRLLAAHRPKEYSWERVVCEESLIYLSLQTDSDSHVSLQQALARVIRSLLGRMRDAASARWALYLFHELPEVARRTEAAQLLRAVASVILNTSHDEVADIVASQNAKWIFAEYTRVGIRWTGDHLIINEPPQPGDPFVEVPATRPRIVIITTPDEGRKKVLRISRWKYGWTRATTLPRLIKTAAGAEYRLDDVHAIWEKLQRDFENKTLVTGVVRRWWRNGYQVDIGLEAYLPERELLLSGGTQSEIIGSTVQVMITSMNQKKGRINVSCRDRRHSDMQTQSATWLELQKHFDSNNRITGMVTAVGHSGCVVQLLDLNVFVPFNELQPSDEPTGHSLVSRSLEFEIVELKTEERRISLTRRFEEWGFWKRLFQFMETRQVVSGKVLETTKGGVMVDIGVAAFAPASQLDIAPPLHFAPYIGQTYDFRIEKLTWDRRNIIVGRRELLEEELAQRRDSVLAKIKVGDSCRGVVVNIVDFGAFIDLGGLAGLLHITDMSWGTLGHPSDLVKVGQELDVIVLTVDHEKGRVSLGLKQMTRNPWNNILTQYPVGSRVKGRVSNVVPYGVFVELEPSVEGLIHISEVSWDKGLPKLSEIYEKGDEVEAVILGVKPEEQRISLGVRQLVPNPWDTADQRYPIGKRVRGRVISLKDYGVFVELEPGIDGMIHVSDLSATREVIDPSEILAKDDTVEAVVLFVDKTKQHIALSMKQIEKM